MWIGIAGVLLVVWYVMLTFFSLESTHIQIVADRDTYDIEKLKEELAFFSGTHLFSLRPDEIHATIKNIYPFVAQTDMNYVLPNGIQISIASFPPIAQFLQGDSFYWLYQNGRVSPALEEGIALPEIIFDIESMDDIFLDFVEIFLEVQTYMTNIYPEGNISYVWYQEAGDLIVRLNDTYLITSFIWASALEDLQNLWAPLEDLVYVDLRVPSMMYTCSRSELYCYSNLYSMYPGVTFRE